ncbi:hypothetical protein [Fodinicola feengrottensis]|uniref:hypothetical protein n=1 Tax=Fodinicola feengrottensis TaxID=435914 RepID=UPI00244336F4|nr:hypothetical protein [Fodinicola feengrottensis]
MDSCSAVASATVTPRTPSPRRNPIAAIVDECWPCSRVSSAVSDPILMLHSSGLRGAGSAGIATCPPRTTAAITSAITTKTATQAVTTPAISRRRTDLL